MTPLFLAFSDTHSIVNYLFVRMNKVNVFLFQASASVMIAGRAVSWMMLGKLLLLYISSSRYEPKATTEADNSFKTNKHGSFE